MQFDRMGVQPQGHLRLRDLGISSPSRIEQTDKLYVAGRLYPLVSIANLWREEGSSWKISWSEIAKDFAATDDSLKKWITLSTEASQDSTHFMMTRSSEEKKVIWVANKGFEISKFEFKFWRA